MKIICAPSFTQILYLTLWNIQKFQCQGIIDTNKAYFLLLWFFHGTVRKLERFPGMLKAVSQERVLPSIKFFTVRRKSESQHKDKP